MLKKLVGMVLSEMPMGEFDKRLVILTEKRGKITAFAKGARRPKSPLLAPTSPFTCGEFCLYEGKNSYNLSSVDVMEYFADIRNELENIYLGMYMCEVADYFTRENMRAADELNLLYKSFKALSHPKFDRRLVRCVFEFKMLCLSGYMPGIFECSICGKKGEGGYFDLQNNKLICEECRRQAGGNVFRLSSTSVYTLQRIATSKINELYNFALSDAILDELSAFMGRYFLPYERSKFKTAPYMDII